MIKPIVGAVALTLVASAASTSQAQVKPFACAADQFTPAEQATLGVQIWSEVKSLKGRLPEPLLKKIEEKVDLCPQAKVFKDHQWGMAFDYAEAALILSGANSQLPLIDGSSAGDVFWQSLPENVQQEYIALGSYDDDPYKAAEAKMMEQFRPLLVSFARGHQMDGNATVALLASSEARAGMIYIERTWAK